MTDGPQFFPAGKHLSTQTEYPWRAAVRTAGASFISACALGVAAAPIIEQAAEKILPGTPVAADIALAAAALGVVTGAIDRIVNLPQFAQLLTNLHLGPIPKND